MQTPPEAVQFNPQNERDRAPNVESVLFDPLAVYDPDEDRFESVLAESWSFSSGSDSVEITLRDDYTWHEIQTADGTVGGGTIDASDLERQLRIDMSLGASYTDVIDSISTPSSHTVRIDFEEGINESVLRFDLLQQRLAYPPEYFDADDSGYESLSIQPSEGMVPIGSGPYKFDELTDDTVTLSLASNHPAANSLQIDEMVFEDRGSESEQWAGLADQELSGSGQAYFPDQFRRFEGATPVESLAGNGSGVTTGGPTQEPLGVTGNQSLAGHEFVVGYSRVPGTKWTVLVHADAEQVYGPVIDAANQGFAATIVGVLVIVVAGAFVGRSITGSINELTRKTRQMQNGDLEVALETDRIDAIGDLYVGLADMRDALQKQITEAQQAQKQAEVSRAEALEMNSYLEKKAEEFSVTMEETAGGDLTQRMEMDGKNSSMDDIAEDFNRMVEEFEKTIGQLSSFAEEVKSAGEMVDSSSESVRTASEQVASSVQSISDDAYEQKEQLQDIATTMDGIASDLASVESNNDNVDFGNAIENLNEISHTLNEAVELSTATLSEAESAAGAAQEQAAELNEVSQRANELSRYARPLLEVLDRFQTESAHEFYFPTGPGSEADQTVSQDD